MFFFCKHETAYEVRISDWSSDVCSSDLQTADFAANVAISANGGTATGVISTGASGAVQVNAHDGFSVTNDGGAATGLRLFSGASQAVVLTDGLNVTGTGAIGARESGLLGKRGTESVDSGGRGNTL